MVIEFFGDGFRYFLLLISFLAVDIKNLNRKKPMRRRNFNDVTFLGFHLHAATETGMCTMRRVQGMVW